MRFFKIRVLNRRWFRDFKTYNSGYPYCPDNGYLVESESEIYINEDEIVRCSSHFCKVLDLRGKGLVAGKDYKSDNYSCIELLTEKAGKTVLHDISKSNREKCGKATMEVRLSEMRFGVVVLKHAVCTNLGLNGTEFEGQSFVMNGEDFDRLVEELTVRDLTK